MNPPIACQLHDYIEIACLYGLEIQLMMKDGSCLQGRAMTTKTINREEFLLIKVQQQEISIPLQGLKKMTALGQNPHFNEIVF